MHRKGNAPQCRANRVKIPIHRRDACPPCKSGARTGFFMRIPIAAVALGIALQSGCSTIGVRIQPPARNSSPAMRSSAPDQADRWLREAGEKHITRGERIRRLVEAARHSLPAASRGDRAAQTVYKAAVGEIVGALDKMHFEGDPEVRGMVEIVRSGSGVLDPGSCDSLLAADRVRISGLHGRSAQEGLGVPYVFSYSAGSPALAGQPGVPRAGMSVPATAVLTFDDGRAQLSFRATLVNDRISIGGRQRQLAADFSAPMALMVSQTGNRALDIPAMFLSRQRLGRSGLFQFQPFDPEKIPVVFVHGLLSRPEAWTQAVNGLLSDPEIRRKYQFWFMLYPTGLPVWKSAALLRSELDRYQEAFEKDGRNLHRIVLIGHSMGGLISSLIIRQGGDELWRQFSTTGVDEIPLSRDARQTLERLIFFQARTDISRVIFIATPHRGSRMAFNPIARAASRLIMLPRLLSQDDRRALVASLNNNVRDFVASPATSIRFLKSESPFITSILRLPLSGKIPYHSIIGDRGRGDSPNSSDGVVPYYSAHLPTAVSEKIVPADHGAHEHPEAVAEIRRILRENLSGRAR